MGCIESIFSPFSGLNFEKRWKMIPSISCHPVFSASECGHLYLGRADSIELFADDLLDLMYDPHSMMEEDVGSGKLLADISCLKQKTSRAIIRSGWDGFECLEWEF